jgi:hypothetical protein
MEQTLKFIKENYPDIEVFENLKINNYFTAKYVVAQNGIIKAVFVNYKSKPDSLPKDDIDLYYSSSGKTDGITFYFSNAKIYRNKQGIRTAEIEEITNKEEILKLFSKDVFVMEYEVIDKNIESCIKEISILQKIAIEKFNGINNLDTQIHLLQIDYISNYKRKAYFHNIKYKNSENEIFEIWLSYNSEFHQIKFKEECGKEYINGFELNFIGKNPYLNYQRVVDDCKKYQETLMNTEYLVSIIH